MWGLRPPFFLDDEIMKADRVTKKQNTDNQRFRRLPKLLEKKQWEEAEPLFDEFVAERSADLVGYNNFVSYARLKFHRGNNVDAEKAAMLAISVDEYRVEAPEFLLELYMKQKLFSKALAVADKLLAVAPSCVEYKLNRLTVLSNLHQSDNVIEEWRQIEQVDIEAANRPSAQHTVLNALLSDGRIDEASLFFKEFKSKNPDWSAWLALSEPHILVGEGRYREAIDSLTESMNKDPSNPVWQWNRSLIRLSSGDLKAGWEDYEIRWSWDDFPSPKRNLNLPLWTGEDLKDRSIVISAEQGIGDQIMFSSILASLIPMRPAKVRVEVQDKIVPLFEIWYPEFEIAAWKNDESIDADLERSFDFHCPMATVCGNLMTDNNSIVQLPRRRIRISEHEKRDILGDFFDQYDIRIGLAWRSSAIDGERVSQYMNVNMCDSIIRSLPDSVGFVVVQYKLDERERDVLAKYPNVFLPVVDLFDDVVMNGKYCGTCDVVVSPATAVVQLSGLFGVPCITWGAESSWVTLGCDQPPWFAGVHRLKHKPNMAKGEMVHNLSSILRAALPETVHRAE